MLPRACSRASSWRSSWPSCCSSAETGGPTAPFSGEVPELGGWHSTAEHPEAAERPGIVVFRWEAPLFFANSGQFRDQVRRLARERAPDWIVLQCEAITDIDVTAAEVLKELDEELNDRGVHLAFVEMRDRLHELVRRYGLHTTLDQEHFYPSLDQALDAIANGAGDNPRPPDEGITPP